MALPRLRQLDSSSNALTRVWHDGVTPWCERVHSPLNARRAPIAVIPCATRKPTTASNTRPHAPAREGHTERWRRGWSSRCVGRRRGRGMFPSCLLLSCSRATPSPKLSHAKRRRKENFSLLSPPKHRWKQRLRVCMCVGGAESVAAPRTAPQRSCCRTANCDAALLSLFCLSLSLSS